VELIKKVTTLDAGIIPELIEGLLGERKSILVSFNCTLAVFEGIEPRHRNAHCSSHMTA
jgi:hypothetical protein